MPASWHIFSIWQIVDATQQSKDKNETRDSGKYRINTDRYNDESSHFNDYFKKKDP